MERENMNEDEKPISGWWAILVILVASLIIGIAGSCTTTKYVEVETVVDRYTHSVDTVRDSIYNDVYVNQYIKGDTVFKDRIQTIYKYAYRSKIDTFIQTDSIPYPVEVIKEVEKKRPLMDWISDIITWIFILTGIIILLKVFIKR